MQNSILKMKVLNIALVVFVAGILSLGVSAITPEDAFAGTWKKDSVGWWYKNDNGSYPKNAWQKIGGKWYHFDKKGYMQTGWIKTGGKWYYLKGSGAMKTGWVKDGGKWYYLSSSGAMQTGWVKVGGKWYYMNKSGVMQADKWVGKYYLKSNGAMATNEWIYDGYSDIYDGSDIYYYVNDSGKRELISIRIRSNGIDITREAA